jgi:plastocyanin
VRVGVTFAAVLGAFLLCACALLVVSAGAARADNPVLTGDVGQGDAFSISLKDASGAAVKHLDAGTYTLVVHDHSAFHNFDLSGPGVAVTTDVDAVVDKTFTITLTDGTYFFQCDPHAAQMRGSFTVGSVTTTTTTTPTPTPAPAPTNVSASIAGSASSFRPSSGLSAGTFAITVNDRSATDGFRLSGPGVSKATGAKFRGKVTWKVKLSAGRYSYGSALHPKLRHTITVSA